MEDLQLLGSIGYATLAIIGMWGIFAKAGEPGWKSLIPLYNIFVLCRVAGLSGWLVLLFFIPVANLLTWIYVAHRLAQSFGKGIGHTLGLIFLGALFLPLLGWGEARYQRPTGAVQPA